MTPLLALCACLPRPESQRALAERLVEQHRYDEAAAAYRRHIQDRLAVKDRPDWENPFIYLLEIGDLCLMQGAADAALKHYASAEQHGVPPAYVNDRYLGMARRLEEQGRPEDALEHLKRYRSRDPALFDIMLDRLAKEIVAREKQE